MQPFPEWRSQPSESNINPIELWGISLLPLAKWVNNRVLNKLRKLMIGAPLTPIVLDKTRKK